MSTRRSSSGSRMTMSRLEGASSSSESDTSVSSRGSRRTKTPRRSRRRLKPRRDARPSPDPTESVCTIEYVDGVPSHTCVIEVACPPRDAKSITSLPGLSWKNFFRDLKAGDIEQVCLITDAESAPRVINSIELSGASSRPKSAEPKSAREKRFAAQTWEALKASGNSVYETAREFTDVFPDKRSYQRIVAFATRRICAMRSPRPLLRNTRNQIDRYHLDGDLLCYNIDRFDAPQVVVPNDDDIRARIIHEFHDSPMGAHLGREKTFAAVSHDFYWPRILHPLLIATEVWRSVSMDFVFVLPPDADGRNGVLVFVDRFTKMVHLTPVSDTVTVAETAAHFVDCVFRHHGLPESIVSDRDPRFKSEFWTALVQCLGTKLSMSTAAHPETDDQTERVNRVLEDVLRRYATSFTSWSKFLPLAEFALNNAEHASTGVTPFFANNARHPRVPALLAVAHPTVPGASTLGGDDDDDHDDDNGVDDVVTSGDHDPEALHAVTRSKSKQALAAPRSAASPLAAWTARTLIDPGNTGTPIAANYTPKSPARQVDNAAVSAFVQRRESIARFVRDALQDAVDKQKENADKRGRKNMATFTIGEQVLLFTDSIRSSAVTNLGASKLAPRFIGPFRVMKVNGEAYTLDIPTSLRLHPTFYVGRLKKYYPATVPSAMDPPASTPERRVNAPPDAPPPSPTAAAVPPSAVPRRHAVPTPESVPATPVLTGAPLQAPFSHVRPVPSPPQSLPERPEHDSLQLRHPPGSSRRERYRREPPPPIVDSAGQTCWIVDRLVGHEDPIVQRLVLAHSKIAAECATDADPAASGECEPPTQGRGGVRRDD
ncbi:unnamed protein product [Phytophthora fragariaefolia]|uniref:Unnamed protein product n=1 Tax=Phytophthora fragariaefolia TaxID=1490495 RepID=A0A9W6XWW9_9STRA|nr:unnamed protein product [Phytophthora fragariaefolia]